MSKDKKGIAESLTGAVTKEATGQAAKWIVNLAKAALFALMAAIFASAVSLLNVNPIATAGLLLFSFAAGFLIGLAVGWRRASSRAVKQLSAKDTEIEKLKDQLRISKLPGTYTAAKMLAEARNATPDGAASPDPFNDLSPTEAAMILEVYENDQLHVGTDGLATARNLRRREIALRTDAPESDVISNCDIALTDDWRRLMNERAGELRSRLQQ